MSGATASGSGTTATGLLLIATGIAAAGLLSIHPGGQASDFAGVLKEESDNRIIDAIVHGGFVVVLTFQLVCFTLFSRWLGLARPTVVAGLIFFAIGAAFFCASMVLDGIVTPAIAFKYVAKPDKIDFAKSLFILVGALISTLMPAGMFFQSLGIASWGFALMTKPTPSRAAGVLALTIGGVLCAALAVTAGSVDPLVLMAGIVMLAIWAIAAGLLLVSRPKPTLT